ncbi:MAG: DUF4259 domain-containing protein [Patescibacteria group bacterium]
MGAWGYKNFENDDALDFLYEVEENNKLAEEIIDKVSNLKSTDYLDSQTASQALAAIELFAAKKGTPSGDFGFSETKIKLETLPFSPVVLEKSKMVISRISSNSELRELMNEGGNEKEFTDVLNDLNKRIEI